MIKILDRFGLSQDSGGGFDISFLATGIAEIGGTALAVIVGIVTGG